MVVTDEVVHVDGHGHQERDRKGQLCTNGRVTALVLVLTLLVVAAVALLMTPEVTLAMLVSLAFVVVVITLLVAVAVVIVVVAAVVLLMAATESDYSNHTSVTGTGIVHDITNTSINTLSLLPPLPLPRLLSLEMS